MRQTSLSKIAVALLTVTLGSAAVGYDRYGSGSTGSYDSGSASCASGDGTNRARSLQVVGLTDDNRLICFNESDPGNARSIGFVSGLFGERLVGIDFRVQDKKLYGVGNNGGVYILDTSYGTATKVSQLTVALSGTSFGVDFNPAADRLRIVSDDGQNLRHNVNSGGVTATDAPLNYTPGMPLNSVGPTAKGIVGSAYTNNDLSTVTTATTLYALDSSLDQIAIQSPPNNGSLAATGKLTVDAGPNAGFDIYSVIRDGVTVDVQSLAVLATGTSGTTGLYSIKLPTGKATLRGNFAGSIKVIDIAIPLNQL